MKHKFVILMALLFLLGNGCAVHKRVFRHGETASRQGDWDMAVRHFLKAVEKQPDNVEYRISLSRALITASNIHLRRGGNFFKDGELKLALLEFDKSLEYNPENNEARRQKRSALKRVEELKKKYREKTEIEILKEKAEEKELFDSREELTVKTFDFKVVKQGLKNIFKALHSVSGVNFLFDESYKDKIMSIDLEQTTVLTVLETIVRQTKLFYKIIDAETIVIIPDTTNKRREYEERVMKTFFLSEAEPEEIRKIVTSLTGIKTIAMNKTLNSLTLTAVPGKLKIAEKIIQTHDKPRGEVVIEIEVIEVNKKAIQEYGIELSQYQVSEYYSPGPIEEASTSSIRLNSLKHTDASDFLLSLPSVNYKLLKFNSRSKIKARPRLRVMDKEQVKVRLGDKVPIPTTTFVPQYGGNTPNQQPITSYKMEEIGINIDITPRVHHDGLVTLQTKFELTFITDPGTPTLPPTIGNRSVESLLRLRDNETSIMAGLLRDTERRSVQGLPILSDLPVLKQIFSGNKKEIEQTDIIITITPRVVRFPEIDEEDLDYLWVGTLEHPGLRESPPFTPHTRGGGTRRVHPLRPTTIDKSFDRTFPKVRPPGGPPEARPPRGQGSQPPAGDKIRKQGPRFTFHVPVEIKAGDRFPVRLRMAEAGAAKVIKIEIGFDADLLQVTEVGKSELLKKREAKSHFLKTYDNSKGTVRLNIAVENSLPDKAQEIAIIHFRAKTTGQSDIRPMLLEVLDANMKNIESICSPITIEVEK